MNATYDNEHEWFTDQIATYLAGGIIDPAERQRFESHAAQCAACLAELAQARRMETKMSELFALTMPPADFEDRVVSRLRFRLDQRPRIHPMVRKAAVAAAVALLLGGTGYVCQNMLTTGKSPSFSLLDTTPTQIAQKVKGMFMGSSKSAMMPQMAPATQPAEAQKSDEIIDAYDSLDLGSIKVPAAPLPGADSDAHTQNVGSFVGTTGNLVVTGNGTLAVNSGKLPSGSVGVSNGTTDFSNESLVSSTVTNHGILAPYVPANAGDAEKQTVVVTGPTDQLKQVKQLIERADSAELALRNLGSGVIAAHVNNIGTSAQAPGDGKLSGLIVNNGAQNTSNNLEIKANEAIFWAGGRVLDVDGTTVLAAGGTISPNVSFAANGGAFTTSGAQTLTVNGGMDSRAVAVRGDTFRLGTPGSTVKAGPGGLLTASSGGNRDISRAYDMTGGTALEYEKLKDAKGVTWADKDGDIAGAIRHNTGTAQIAQNTSAYMDVGAGTANLGGNRPDLSVVNGDVSFAGPGKISGNSNLTKTGAGTLVVDAARNTFGNDGTALWVKQGAVEMTHRTPEATGTVQVNGGALSLRGRNSSSPNQNAPSVTVGNGNAVTNVDRSTAVAAGTVQVQNTGSFDANGFTSNLGALRQPVAGEGVLSKAGTGQVRLSGGNALSGPVVINQGIPSGAARAPENETTSGAVTVSGGALRLLNQGANAGQGSIGALDFNGASNPAFLVVDKGVTGAVTTTGVNDSSKSPVAAAADSASVLNSTAPGMGRSAGRNFTYTAGGASWTNANTWLFGNAVTNAAPQITRFSPSDLAMGTVAPTQAPTDGKLRLGFDGAPEAAGVSSSLNTSPSVNHDYFYRETESERRTETIDGQIQSDATRLASIAPSELPATHPTAGFTTQSGTMSLPQPAQSGGALISSAALAQATTRPAGGPAGNANQGATQPLDTSVPKEVAERLVREANAANAAAARRVIREGVMEFEVDSFDSAFNQIATIVGEEGGFIAAADSDKLPNGKVRGTITVRVPPDRLDLLVLKLRALGELKSQKLGSRDIGKEYTDLESDLRASRAMETRLLDIIAKAPGKVNELLEAENKLGEVRTHIEKIMGTLNYYNNLISMATLTVNVAEKDIRTPASADIREEINAGVETEDVETARTAALKAIDDAKGRIVESTLQKLEAGQFAAKIVAEVSPDAAGPIVDRLKQLGRLARYDVQKKQVIENAKPNATVQAQPPVRLETVPTRIVISMYNLANVAPRLTTNLNLAGDDVEAVYRAILKRVTDAGGRIISSNLNKQDAAQVSGTIQYELKSADADAVLNDVRQQALVLRMTVTENPDTANVTTAKQAFTAQIIPTSQLTPKLVSNLNLAAQDVETVYNAVLKRINDSAGARVITSNLNRQDASRISGTIQFEVKSPDADAVLNDIRNQGLVLSLNVTENADGVNVTTTKRGFTATISPIAQLTPKLTTNMSIAAQDVEATYNAILKAVQESEGARVISSNLNRQDAMQAVGALQIEAKSVDAATLLSKIRQNVQVLQMNVIESPAGSNVTAEKQAFTVQVIPTSQVNPRETRVLGIQTSNVEGAVQVVNAAVSGAGGRIIESSMSQDRGGNSVARMVVEVPLDKADSVSDNIRKQGTVRASESSKNTQVPEGPLARARLNLTIATGETIVPTEGGFGNSIREGLSTSIKGLLWSLQLIVIGLCLIGPWVLIVWGGWRIARKRKAVKPQP